MRPETMLQDCDQALQALLPDQNQPVQKTVAAVLCVVVRARSVVLSRRGRQLPGQATARGKQQQAHRLVALATGWRVARGEQVRRRGLRRTREAGRRRRLSQFQLGLR